MSLAWLASMVLGLNVQADQPERLFALVVGNNMPPGERVPALHWADDDAVRWYVTWHTLGAVVEVLTDLDRQSERLYGDAIPAHQPVTRASLRAAMDRLSRQISEARRAGARTVFYFVYAGHGELKGDEGQVTFSDGPLTRDQFYAEVLERSPAHVNHVIVDACSSYYFVFQRGSGGSRRPWMFGSYAGASSRFPNTGFLLSTSSSSPSHEYEDFQGGIFSHELLSGLLGAADFDADGHITYRELSAFVRLANEPVRNDRYRPQLLSRPPSAGSDVVVTLPPPRAGAVSIQPGSPRRLSLEDDRGIRWADFHAGADASLQLRLPEPPWKPAQFFLSGKEGEYTLAPEVQVNLEDIPLDPARVIQRGGMERAFRDLFAQPFDRRAIDRALALSLEDRPEEVPFLYRSSTRTATVGLALGTLAGSLGLFGWMDRQGGADRYPKLANVASVSMLISLGSFLTWAVLDALAARREAAATLPEP